MDESEQGENKTLKKPSQADEVQILCKPSSGSLSSSDVTESKRMNQFGRTV